MAFVYWILRRLGITVRDAAIRLIAMNTGVYLVFGGLGWVAALIGLVDPNVPLAMAVPWLAGFPVILVAARWFTQPRRLARWTGPEGGGLLRRSLAIGVSAAAWVRRALVAPDGRDVFAWSGLYWLGDLLSLWAALRAFGESTSAAALTIAYATGYLAQSVPIPLVATGGVDAADDTHVDSGRRPARGRPAGCRRPPGVRVLAPDRARTVVGIRARARHQDRRGRARRPGWLVSER